VVAAWRLGRAGPWWVVGVAAVELGLLYYHGVVEWGWAVRLPANSPALTALAREPDVGLVAGELGNIPVRLGLTPAFPYLGIIPPPPNYLLQDATRPARPTRAMERWFRRFGVTHGVWDHRAVARNGRVVFRGDDAALDTIVPRDATTPAHRRWRVERYPDTYPRARAALRDFEETRWERLYTHLSLSDDPEEVWFLAEDRPPPGPSPRARHARVTHWDGRTAVVEHDGTCDLVMRRTYYPGWTGQVDDGPERPVSKADGGLQSVRVPGTGVSRVVIRYRPTGIAESRAVSLAGLVAVAMGWAVALVRDRGRKPGDLASEED
jgi:hypothetical protein